uniref:RING-type domain-containing protein n=1 Tax=Setaria digitata TaxID=48799 RepID=A0A915Q1H8_9BILA
MQQGDRVRIAYHDLSFYERIHNYNQLAWSQRMATYIGKVGIVKDVTMESVQVTIFSWGTSEGAVMPSTSNQDGKNQPENGRNTVVEATYSWHPKTVLLAQNVCLLDGDRAIMIRNKDLSKAIMVSVRILDDETYALRLPHAESFIWKQSENPNDVILPIYSGRNLSTLMRDRNLPTHLASVNRTPERVVFGVAPTEANPNDIMEALRYWAETGDEKQFRLLIYYHPELKNASIDGRTPLMLAVHLGLWTAVVVLLCIGAEKKITDPDGNNLYHIAAKRGHEHIIEGLMIFSADDINYQNFKGETPLHCSILSGSLSCIDRLLNAPMIDPNIQDNNGNTPLHILSGLEDIPIRGAMLHRLLSNVKVDQLMINNDGLTALQIAIIANEQKVVESMIRMKPSLLISDSCHSLLPLHLAAAYGHITVLEIILKHFSDVTKTTKASRTALHFAVERWDGNADKDMQRLSCIQLLVSLGIPLNTRDCDGMTALHLAAQTAQGQAAISNNKIQAILEMKKSNMRLEELASAFRPQWPIAVMCFLLAQGADPLVRDRSGYTPFEFVNEPTLKSLFEQYATCRPRSCVPMSRTIVRSFDTTGVTMCTFNCDDNVADVVFIPCGHRVVCGTCAGSTLLRRCPLCYQQIVAAKNSCGEIVEIGGKVIRCKECGDTGLNEAANVIDDVQIQKIAQEAVERAKKAVEEEKNEIVRELRDKLEQLELEVTCAICMDHRCSIVFQCGHTACVECSNPSKLKLCHICRQTIKRRTTIYT